MFDGMADHPDLHKANGKVLEGSRSKLGRNATEGKTNKEDPGKKGAKIASRHKSGKTKHVEHPPEQREK